MKFAPCESPLTSLCEATCKNCKKICLDCLLFKNNSDWVQHKYTYVVNFLLITFGTKFLPEYFPCIVFLYHTPKATRTGKTNNYKDTYLPRFFVKAYFTLRTTCPLCMANNKLLVFIYVLSSFKLTIRLFLIRLISTFFTSRC